VAFAQLYPPLGLWSLCKAPPRQHTTKQAFSSRFPEIPSLGMSPQGHSLEKRIHKREILNHRVFSWDFTGRTTSGVGSRAGPSRRTDNNYQRPYADVGGLDKQGQAIIQSMVSF
jgi:hypothetical protein